MIVDIIVPTYNRPDDLCKFIEEVSKQKYPELNVYIIDDHSDCDLSLLIPATSVFKYTRLESNSGQAFARNFALKHSHGDIVVLLDDDAWFVNINAIESIADYFTNDAKLGGVMFDLQEPGRELLSVQRKLNDKDEIGSFIACACAFRRDALMKVGGFTNFLHSYGEETDLTLKLFAEGYKLLFSNKILVYHNYQPVNRSKAWYLRFRKNSVRNDMLIILMRFPWYIVLPYCIGKFSSHLIFTIRSKRYTASSIAATFSGFISALALANKALAQRKPVSMEVLKTWLKLRW